MAVPLVHQEAADARQQDAGISQHGAQIFIQFVQELVRVGLFHWLNDNPAVLHAGDQIRFGIDPCFFQLAGRDADAKTGSPVAAAQTFTLHLLRGSAAGCRQIILINNGTDILAVSRRLGHTKASTTLNFYGHILQQADAQSSECIADVLLRNKGSQTEKNGPPVR